jgi:hypothetical protein
MNYQSPKETLPCCAVLPSSLLRCSPPSARPPWRGCTRPPLAANGPALDALVAEVAALNPAELSPREALEALYALKAKLAGVPGQSGGLLLADIVAKALVLLSQKVAGHLPSESVMGRDSNIGRGG